MNKPDWKDAPEWAGWLGQCENGDWEWYENQPVITSGKGYWFHGEGFGCRASKDHPNPEWRSTLEARPVEVRSTHDEVNNPKHYDLFPGQQSIDVIKAALTEEEWRGFLKGNIIKYRLRAGQKGPADKCLAKADWYKAKLWGDHENLD